jgi:imidazolonepropionase
MSATREASRSQLVDLARTRLKRMLQHGTTTAEIKTGYGLDLTSELNMFEAIYDLGSQESIDLIPTFMPAHAFPPGSDHSVYVDQIVTDMLPQAREISQRRSRESGRPCAKPFVDVFCDQGYFSLAQTQRIFDAGRANDFALKVHSDEFVNLGATTLAAQYGATSCDHLLNISEIEIELLSRSGTVAVLLPGTSFYLNLREHAPARNMIDSGVAVALGSDFNPGSCHIFSLTMILGLACLHLKMTPQEALTALTLNAAWAVGRGDSIGMLREGYQADITIYDVSTLEEIPYNIGWNTVVNVIKRGSLVVA